MTDYFKQKTGNNGELIIRLDSKNKKTSVSQ